MLIDSRNSEEVNILNPESSKEVHFKHINHINQPVKLSTHVKHLQ